MLAHYPNLTTTEQHLVKLGALLWETTLHTKIAEIFNASIPTGKGINPISSPLTKINLAKLVEIGYFIDQKAGQYRINTAFADLFCEQNWHTDDELRLLIMPIQNRTPLYFNYNYNSSIAGDRHFRDMRFAYFQGMIDPFKENFRQVALSNLKSWGDLLDYYLPKNFDLEKLEFAFSRIRAYLLCEKLKVTLNYLSSVDGYYYYAIEQITAFDPRDKSLLAQTILQLAILRGEYEVIEKLKEHAVESYQMFIKAWLSFQQARDQNQVIDALAFSTRIPRVERTDE